MYKDCQGIIHMNPLQFDKLAQCLNKCNGSVHADWGGP